MEKTITCEISFIPIGTKDYNKDIEQVIEMIASYGMEYHVGLLSTTVRGEKNKVFEMLQQIFDASDKKMKFTMTVKLSNECGCDS
jgi:uncharacterized protein YqgV (UPF0045/DUF77 family)